MHQRQMRVGVSHVPTFFNGHEGTIVNISKTGALLSFRRRYAFGDEEGVLSFEIENSVLEVKVRVIREHVEQPLPRSRDPLWYVAVAFDPEMRRESDRIVRQVMSAQRFPRIA